MKARVLRGVDARTGDTNLQVRPTSLPMDLEGEIEVKWDDGPTETLSSDKYWMTLNKADSGDLYITVAIFP